MTPKQISGIIAAADDDGDGVVDYNELAGLVYQTVKHMAREDWIRNRAFRNRRAAVKSRSEILATRDDTLEANIASMSTDDTTHLRDFDTGGRQAKLTNQRSVRIRSGGTSPTLCRRGRGRDKRIARARGEEVSCQTHAGVLSQVESLASLTGRCSPARPQWRG